MRKLALALSVALAPASAFARGPGVVPNGSLTLPGVIAPIVRSILGAPMELLASFYGHGERLARHTASGEVFNPFAMTAAHRTLPLGTLIRVTYQGQSVVVRINDRGPATWTGRSLDLSYGAARALGLDRHGVGRVEVAILS